MKTKLPQIIEAQATCYPHMVSVFIPSTPIIKSSTGNTQGKICDSWVSNNSQNKETSTERSIRRTKKQISDYVLCNKFELWATFTYARKGKSETQMRQQMMDWLRNQKRTYGNFSYILVPEYQKDGTIHFHAFLKGYGGSIKRAINPNTGLPLRNTYNLTGYTHGFTKVSYISQTKDSMSKLACYLTKYVKKELLDHENQKRYWASKDLIKPNVKNNPEKWYEENEPDWQIETENGRVMRFYTGKNPEIDSFIKENAP